MVWKRGSGTERGYHHGNLKEALVRAALALIAEKGPAGFTFADAARWAGVSPAAPYRHYRDRDELLADVARRGFDEFTDRLSQSLGRAASPIRRRPSSGSARPISPSRAPSPRSIRRCSRPAFRPMPARNCVPPVTAPSRWCARACEALSALLPQAKRPPALMMALHIWALSHGIASLFARGDGSQRALPMSAEDLLEAGVLVYLSGLGLHGR